MNYNQWILEGEVGTSSQTIWAVMMGAVKGKRNSDFNYDIPHDMSDFARCYKLLELFPEWKSRLHEVSEVFPKWIPIIREWDNLSDYYKKITDSSNRDDKGVRLVARKAWDFIDDLNNEAMFLDGWICQHSLGSWCRDSNSKVLQSQYCINCKNKCKYEVIVDG